MHRFFGYGSLVNRRTHGYGAIRRERIEGWRRTWRHTDFHGTAFLTAVRDEASVIEGLTAEVPGGDWAALDLREAGYLKAPLPGGAMVYHIPHDHHPDPGAPRPILLSYLDVVVQGYATEFGEAGVARFFETTDGWEAPVEDDRAAPLYPRAQVLEAGHRALVDRWLTRVT